MVNVRYIFNNISFYKEEDKTMKITNISEKGSNNILKWCINEKYSIKGNYPLYNILNGDLTYDVTISDVNTMELFRLTQLYKNELKIIESKSNSIEAVNELIDLNFPE